MDRMIVFDIQGPYALFRKPYSAYSPVSFPFPPPTSVLGLLGAIAGYGKEEYLERLGRGEHRIGIRLLRPVRKYRVSLNLIDTKGSKHFLLKAANPRFQVPYEFLKDVGYRIFFFHSGKSVMDDLLYRLENGKSAFTPSLGLANCLANLEWVGHLPVRKQSFDSRVSLDCVVPLDDGVVPHYGPGRKYLRIRVPAAMNQNREVTDYREALVEENGLPIEADVNEFWECHHERLRFF